VIRQLKIRESIEERENCLAPRAAKSKLSRGRLRDESPCPIRTAFQRDRDRIIYCKSFRRLKHKTQVFIAPLGDHYVTRLTHTLQVSQIARTIARSLKLNEDLAEAISLGHDLGHTPFGHAGEDILNKLYVSGFKHNEQSLRIVDLLENEGRGLNLTWEVRDGILNHSKTGVDDILGKNWGEVGTVEGEICKIADIVAYINHDIDDAIRAGMINDADLPPDAVKILGTSHSQRLNMMICDIIDNSWEVSYCDIIKEDSAIKMSPQVRTAAKSMRDFLFEKVYNIRAAQGETEKAREVISSLYDHFKNHPELLPEEYRIHGEAVERSVVDYIAGMTDHYALRLAEEIKR
jgi:dGTPase